LSAGGDEDVRGLDIAVHDALGVRRREPLAHLMRDIEQHRNGQGMAADPLP
jgi:hypothetical protein